MDGEDDDEDDAVDRVGVEGDRANVRLLLGLRGEEGAVLLPDEDAVNLLLRHRTEPVDEDEHGDSVLIRHADLPADYLEVESSGHTLLYMVLERRGVR